MRKTKLTLLLLAALLVGVCIGFFGNSAIIRARIQKYSQVPSNMPERITEKLTKRLHLDSTQQEQVLAVFMTYEPRMKETREQSRATFNALLEEMRLQIAQHLTPEQQEEHKKMLVEMDLRLQENRALMRAFSPPEKAGEPKK